MVALLFGEAAVAGLLLATSTAAFAISSAALGVFFLFVIPTLLGLVSRIDQTGRSTALGIAVASTGQAVGPGVCGVLAANGGYAPIGWFVGACYLISIAIVVGFLTSWHLARARQPAVA